MNSRGGSQDGEHGAFGAPAELARSQATEERRQARDEGDAQSPRRRRESQKPTHCRLWGHKRGLRRLKPEQGEN